MATVFTESFEGGAVGDTIDDTNTVFSNVIGSPVFATGGVLGQAGSFPSDGTTHPYGIATFTAKAALFVRAYVNFDFRPTTGVPILIALAGGSSGSTNGSVVVTATGKFALRNGSNTTNLSPSTMTVPTGAPVRLVWTVSSGAQTLKIFAGANVNGATPDEILSAAFATTATDTVEAGLKIGTGNVVNLRFDEITADDSLDPGPAVSQALQTLTPVTDVTTAGWTKVPSGAASFSAGLADSSDASYDVSPGSPTGTQPLEVKFAQGAVPSSRNNHVLKLRMFSQNAASTSVVISVRQGSTQIASWTETGLTDTAADYTYSLTSTQAGNITDYSDLRVRIAPTAS